MRRVSRLAIVLCEPLIHFNTGAAGRTSLGFEAELHLIKPLGFSIDESSVKRAGLDYWKNVDLHLHDSWDAFKKMQLPLFDHRVVFSKNAKYGTKNFMLHSFPPCEYTALIFGNEVRGMPEEFQEDCKDFECVYLPMSESIRSYNLSNTVAIATFEFRRQESLWRATTEGQ